MMQTRIVQAGAMTAQPVQARQFNLARLHGVFDAASDSRRDSGSSVNKQNTALRRHLFPRHGAAHSRGSCHWVCAKLLSAGHGVRQAANALVHIHGALFVSWIFLLLCSECAGRHAPRAVAHDTRHPRHNPASTNGCLWP